MPGVAPKAPASQNAATDAATHRAVAMLPKDGRRATGLRRAGSVPEDQQQDDDRERNADQPQQDAFTHDMLLSIVSLVIQPTRRPTVPLHHCASDAFL
jgi:hypothetical protein